MIQRIWVCEKHGIEPPENLIGLKEKYFRCQFAIGCDGILLPYLSAEDVKALIQKRIEERIKDMEKHQAKNMGSFYFAKERRNELQSLLEEME